MWRSRWAAVGAAVAVTLGAGGIGLVHADLGTGDRPVTIAIAPERILDTRTNLGLTGRATNATPRDLQVTGTVRVGTGATKQVVPADATAVLVNVTVVKPDSGGYLSLRPAGATGTPTTSTVNFAAGSVEPNAATVALGPGGKIQAYLSTDNPNGSAHLLLDVVGYTITHTHDDRYYTKTQTDNKIAAIPTGPPGPTGPAGPAASLSSPCGATLRWDLPQCQRSNLATGATPQGVAFDGSSLWITNLGADTVSKMNPATGTKVDYPTGIGPNGVAFDGTSIWVANTGSNTVSKINPATGTKVDFATGIGPSGVAVDGTSIWITNAVSNTVSKMNPATGTKTDYATGTTPQGIAYDGTWVWIANSGSNSVTRRHPVTGASTWFTTGSSPSGVAFDGDNIWITNSISNTVSKMDPGVGTKVDYATGNYPLGIAYDGTWIWIANAASSSVARINPQTGAKKEIGTGSSTSPTGVAFDGTNIWVTNMATNTVTRFVP